MLKNLRTKPLPKSRTQNWLQNGGPDFIAEEITREFTQIEHPGLPHLGKYHRHRPKLNIIAELKGILRVTA